MSDEEPWEVVNYSEKKQLKEKSRKEKKESAAEKRFAEEQAEKQRKRDDTNRFLQQYQNAGNFMNTPFSEDTLFSALSGDVDATAKSGGKKKKKGFDVNTGEELVFNFEEKHKKAPKKHKVDNKPKEKKAPLSEVVSQLDAKALLSFIGDISARFAEDKDVQLKALAEQLEVSLGKADKKSVSASELNKREFPLSIIRSDVSNTIKKYLAAIPEQAINNFFWFLVETLIDIEDGKLDSSGFGLRLLIQIIAKTRPQALIKNIPNITTKFTKKSIIEPKYFKTFYWIFSQFSTDQHVAALTAWFHYLLPLAVESKEESIVDQSLSFVEELLQNKNLGKLDEETAAFAFEKVLIYKNQKISPKLKTIINSLMEQSLFISEGYAKSLFPMLLSHAASNKTEFRDDVLVNLAKLLSKDKSALKVWKDCYRKNVAQSNNLLTYLQLNWNGGLGYAKKIDNDEMSNFVNFVIDSNTKGGKKAKGDAKDIALCTATCNSFKSRLRPVNSSKGTDAQKSKKAGSNADSGSTFVTSAVVVFVSAVGGAAFYLYNNCCSVDQCRNFVLAYPNQFYHC